MVVILLSSAAIGCWDLLLYNIALELLQHWSSQVTDPTWVIEVAAENGIIISYIQVVEYCFKDISFRGVL